MNQIEQLAKIIYANEFTPAHDPGRPPPPRSYQQAQAIINAGWTPPPNPALDPTVHN